MDEIQFDRNVKLEDTSRTLHHSEIGYFVEVEFKQPENKKKKTKNFHLAPEKKTCSQDKFNAHMNKTKPETYMSNKKLICDWTDKKLISSE